MGLNLINISKASVNTTNNLKKVSAKSDDSKFDEILDKSIATKLNDITGKSKKSTYDRDARLHRKKSLREKEDAFKEDKTLEESPVEKTAKNKVDMQEILNLMISMTSTADNIEIGNENIQELISYLEGVRGEGTLGLFGELQQITGAELKLSRLIADMLAVNDEGSIDSALLSRLKALLSGEDKDSFKEYLNDITQQLEDKIALSQTDENAVPAVIKSDVKDTKSGTYDSNSEGFTSDSREDKILKSLLGEKEDNSNKTVSMAAHLNRFKQDINTISEPADIPVVNRSNFNSDIIKAVKYMEVNSLRELTVNINPRELGAITIRITMEAGIMKANIAAANKETLELLNSNLVELKNSLSTPEIKVQDVSINIYNEDTTFFSGNFRDNREAFNRDGQGHGQERVLTAREIEDKKVEQDLAAIDNNLSILA